MGYEHVRLGRHPRRDNAGRVTSVSETSQVQTEQNTTETTIAPRTFEYNGDSQLTKETLGQVAGGAVGYTYYQAGESGPAGAVKTMTLSQTGTGLLTLTYVYDAVSKRLQTIQVNADGQTGQENFTYGYLANTDLIASLNSNGVATRTWSYETNTGRLSQNKTSAGSTVLYQGDFNYYDNDQRSQESVTGSAADAHNWTIHYDTLDQLHDITDSSNSSTIYSYSFDALGNRTDLGTINDLNQYSTGQYDSRGNLTKWNGKTYGYDGLDRMILAEDSAGPGGSYSDRAVRATFGYDSDGRRIWKKSFIYDAGANSGAGQWIQTQYLKFAYDGTNLIATFQVQGDESEKLLQSYAWGQDMGGGIGGLLVILDYSQGSTPTPYFPIYDGSGNIVGLHDAAGNVVATYSYDPFGNQIAQGGEVSRGSATADWASDPQQIQTLELDLASASQVSAVKITGSATYDSLQYWDGSAWADISDISDISATTYQDTASFTVLTFSAVTTNKVRLYLDGHENNPTTTLQALQLIRTEPDAGDACTYSFWNLDAGMTDIRIDPNPGGIYDVSYTPVGSQYAEPATVTRMAEDGGSSLWISVDPLPALDNLTMQNAYSIPYNSTVTMWRSLGSTTGAWDSEGPTQSLELDLPAAKSIDEVKITPEAEFDYVQYFDGHDWQNVADQTITIEGSYQVVNFSAVKTDKIRLLWDPSETPGNVTTTIEAFGNDGDISPFRWQTRWYDPEGNDLEWPNRALVDGRWTSHDPAGESASTNLDVYCQNDPINRIDPFGLADAPSWWTTDSEVRSAADKLWDVFEAWRRGRKSQAPIFAEYESANAGQGMIFADSWIQTPTAKFGGLVPSKADLLEDAVFGWSKLARASRPAQMRPDIVHILSSQTLNTLVYEVKPASQESDAVAEAKGYAGILTAGGLNAKPGPKEQRGTANLDGIMTEWGLQKWKSPADGAIVYWFEAPRTKEEEDVMSKAQSGAKDELETLRQVVERVAVQKVTRQREMANALGPQLSAASPFAPAADPPLGFFDLLADVQERQNPYAQDAKLEARTRIVKEHVDYWDNDLRAQGFTRTRMPGTPRVQVTVSPPPPARLAR